MQKNVTLQTEEKTRHKDRQTEESSKRQDIQTDKQTQRKVAKKCNFADRNRTSRAFLIMHQTTSIQSQTDRGKLQKAMMIELNKTAKQNLNALVAFFAF